MVNTEAITKVRLDRWAELLKENKATPAILIAIGHDEASGQISLYTVEEMGADHLRAFLSYALAQVSQIR